MSGVEYHVPVTGVDPVNAQHLATKNYVDALVNGAEWKQQCRLATAVALPTNVYSNGSSGVGATLTGTAFGALTIDGVTPAVGNRVLVKNEAAPANNGIYIVTTVGAIATLYVLTRATDYDQAAEVAAGTASFVTEGTANADTAWVQTTAGTITMGSTSLVFVQFGSGGAPSGSAGGDLGSTYPNPTVAAIHETTGPTKLTIGSIPDGDYLVRSGSTLIGGSPTPGGPPTGAAGGDLGGTYPNPTVTHSLPPGFEIGYDEITATVNVASTTESSPTTIITCAAHTFDGSPVICEFYTPRIITPQLASSFVIVSLWESTTQIGRLVLALTPAAANMQIGGTWQRRFTPSAGSHTYLIRAHASSTNGTPSVNAGAGGTATDFPAFVRFTKV